MTKSLIYFCLIVINLRLFVTEFVILDKDLSDKKSFDANNYLKLLSKLNSIQNKSLSEDSNQNNFVENVQQLRRFLDPREETTTEECQYVVFYFSLILSQFIECVLVNEKPFSFCLGCSQQYSDLFNAFTDLKNSSISNCSDNFLNGDKVKTINTFYKNSISSWSDGNCNSCFDGKDSNRYLVVNNDTKYYFELTENYMNCIQTHNETIGANSSCVLCKNAFYSVNDYYELVSMNYSGYVCNDIIETMKDIRKQWIQLLECPIDSTTSVHFLALVFIVIVMPFLLYVIGRMFCVENNKTLIKQKRMSTYHLGSYENEPLIQR